MTRPRILLHQPDPAVAAALAFALGLDGFDVAEGPWPAGGWADAALVIDQRQPAGDGLALLDRLRGEGYAGPAVILATNPTRELCRRVAAAGAALVEKPLIGETLTTTLRALLPAAMDPA